MGQTGNALATISTSTEPGTISIQNSSGEVIGSKNTGKYYFPWCGTVKRIKAENQIHFASVEDAKSKGFVPGGNCKGLN